VEQQNQTHKRIGKIPMTKWCMTKFEDWSNEPTFSAAFTIDNNFTLYSRKRDLVNHLKCLGVTITADRVKEFWSTNLCRTPSGRILLSGIDLLRSDRVAMLGLVNWQEIADDWNKDRN
jgi:hypothetical protein